MEQKEYTQCIPLSLSSHPAVHPHHLTTPLVLLLSLCELVILSNGGSRLERLYSFCYSALKLNCGTTKSSFIS